MNWVAPVVFFGCLTTIVFVAIGVSTGWEFSDEPDVYLDGHQ